MKHPLIAFVCSILFVFAVQSDSFAQENSLTSIIKQHFNETVQQVKATDNTSEKRIILDESFQDILTAIDRVEQSGSLDTDGEKQLETLKASVHEKLSQLHGIDGFDEIQDEDLEDFTDYSQQDMEQASRNITISLTTALLIIIILLLL